MWIGRSQEWNDQTKEATYKVRADDIVLLGSQADQDIVMQHYAMREWRHALQGVWHLFGHTHGYLPPFGKSVDVGVDNTHRIVPGASFRPISFEELKAFMDQQPIGPHAEFENYTPKHPEIADLHVIGGNND